MPEPQVTIIRPVLTPEEREKVMERVNDKISAFWIALKQKEAEDAQERKQSLDV